MDIELTKIIIYALFAIIAVFVVLAGIGWGKYWRTRDKLRAITDGMSKKYPVSEVCSNPNNDQNGDSAVF